MEQNAHPNILLILSDDQGAWAMGCYGNKEIKTPNLDRLAASGVRMDSFYCTSPVCSPARASLLTGKIPSQHGVHDWIAQGNMGKEAVQYLSNQVAYTDLLAANGYCCGLSGKWHLGDSMTPQHGFSHWYVHQFGGGGYYNPPMVRNGTPAIEAGYVTDLITQDALDFLNKQSNQQQPFYLSVHYTAPHQPWIDNHPEKFVQLYKDCPFDSCPQERIEPYFTPVSLTADAQHDLRGSLMGYFGAITAMDSGIGKILDQLDTLGLSENTLVCFLSDNGFSCGQHGFWGKGNGTNPLNMYENSVRVPALFAHPGIIASNCVSTQLLSGYDLMPTLLDYVGIDYKNSALPGKSFAPLLQGRQMDQTEPVVILDEYGSTRMVRSREWKYIHRYPNGPHELYCLTSDPDERQNRYNDPMCMEQQQQLRAFLEQWFVRYTDPSNDGLREAVSGRGQCKLSGLSGEGHEAFN